MASLMERQRGSVKLRFFSFSAYFWVIAAIAAAGLADSVYLSISHYRNYTDISYRSFCAISKAINCDTVSQSPYAIFLGVPVPVWGVIGYAFFLGLLFLAKRRDAGRKRIWPGLFVIAAAFSSYSIILALISTFLIHSYCIMCIASYAVNLLLLYYIWLIRKRFDPGVRLMGALKQDMAYYKRHWTGTFSVLLPLGATVMAAIAFYPAYWHFSAPALRADVPTGITAEGYPWIGARKPKLEIMEFADYQCFQCRKMHFFLRELINKYPHKIRLIQRQFPMDNRLNPLVKEPFHLNSGKMALMAEYAKFKGKFWQMNDLLFQLAGKKYINTRKIGAKTGMDYRMLAAAFRIPALRYAVKHDIAVGIKLGIRGTPGFVIDGKVYQGNIPPEILRKVTG